MDQIYTCWGAWNVTATTVGVGLSIEHLGDVLDLLDNNFATLTARMEAIIPNPSLYANPGHHLNPITCSNPST